MSAEAKGEVPRSDRKAIKIGSDGSQSKATPDHLPNKLQLDSRVKRREHVDR